MDLQRLRVLVHVAELGNMSRAAERLGLSQPALSRQIKLLEQELGVRLLDRTGRGVALTEAGHTVERRARAVFDEVAKIDQELAGTAHRIGGQLSVGLPPSVGVLLATPLIERYHAAYPAVLLKVIEDLTGALQDGLLTGRIDIGVLYDGTISASLHAELLLVEELALVGSAASGLSADSAVPLEAIGAYPLILPSYRHGMRAILEQAAFRAGVRLRTVIEADSLRVQLELVRRSLGYTLLPRYTFAAKLEAGELTAAPVTDPPLHRRWVLAWPGDRPLSRAAQAMADGIRAEVARLPPTLR